jgi:hypothetical protein
MAQAEQGKCFTLTPFFRQITRCRRKQFAEIHPTGHTVSVRFDGQPHQVEILQYVAPNGFHTFLLDAAERFHPRDAAHCGFLFREPDLPATAVEVGWRAIVDCAYWPGGDRVVDRLGIPLFDAMVREPTRALLDAIDLYTREPAGYARMIYHGFGMLDRFPWERAVQEYQRVYDGVCS